MALIEVKDVDFRYFGSDFELNGVNFSLSKGDRLIIYGREGVGKTTLLRLLCGLEDYCHGSIYLDGIELNELSQKDMDIGYSFDKRILDAKSQVEDIISMPMKLRKVSQDTIDDHLQSVAKRCDLPMDAQVGALSELQIAM